MDKQPYLYVVEELGDIPSLAAHRGLEPTKDAWRYYDPNLKQPVYIAEAHNLRNRICGLCFTHVSFYEGMFSAQEINYALCRVRVRSYE
jgi:hypothetical protein